MSTKLKSIQLLRLQIPFRTSFKHSSAERSVTEAVIAMAEAADLLTGYGEGCPRAYVTGESLESCEKFLERNRAGILAIDSVRALQEWQSVHAASIDSDPAAWCAIETALLDLFAKQQANSIEAVLGLPELKGSFHYTAVLGASKPEAFAAQLAQYLQLGLTDFKVKVCGEYATDKQNIETLLSARPSARIRIDANNLWDDVDEAMGYVSALGTPFWAVEEPLKAGDLVSLKRFAEKLGCKIILDESFCRLAQCAQLEADPSLWIPNIRISKLGGLLRSLAAADRCQQLGLQFVLGAQVGETSILTRVALSLANSYRDNLLAQEGAFGTYLLTKDITATPIMFGKAGALTPPHAVGHGLGVECIV